MIALLLCAAAFQSSLVFARRSLAQGLLVVLAWGYAYGIARANLLTTTSHFLFDAALLGLYAGQLASCFNSADARRTGQLRGWVMLMILWPMLVCLLPFQPLLVSVVGFRAAVFFLPVAL